MRKYDNFETRTDETTHLQIIPGTLFLFVSSQYVENTHMLWR